MNDTTFSRFVESNGNGDYSCRVCKDELNSPITRKDKDSMIEHLEQIHPDKLADDEKAREEWFQEKQTGTLESRREKF